MGATSDWSWSGVSFLALSALVVSAFAAAGAAAGVGCWATDVRPARSRPAVMKPRVRIITNALRRPLRRPVYLGLLGEWPGGFEPGPARIIPGSRPAAVRPRVAQTIPGKPFRPGAARARPYPVEWLRRYRRGKSAGGCTCCWEHPFRGSRGRQ